MIRAVVVVVICFMATMDHMFAPGSRAISGDALIALYSGSLGYVFGIQRAPGNGNGGGGRIS